MRSGFTLSDLIDEILERSVGETTSAADVISAKRSIYMVLDEWAARQFNTWRITTREFAFQPGADRIPLPDIVDDILDVSVVTNPNRGQATTTPLKRISETEFAKITAKTPGIPSQYVLSRTEPPSLRVIPTGRAGQSETLVVTFIARPAAFDRFGSGIDAPSRWQNALIFGAAADMAGKNPERAGQRLSILPALYQRALDLATENDRQRNSFRMRIG